MGYWQILRAKALSELGRHQNWEQSSTTKPSNGLGYLCPSPLSVIFSPITLTTSQQQQCGLLRTSTEKAKPSVEETNDTVQSFWSCSQWNPALSVVVYSCMKLFCYPRPKKKKKRVDGFCLCLRCHIWNERRSNAATSPHQRGTWWGREDRLLFLGKPNAGLRLTLGYGMWGPRMLHLWGQGVFLACQPGTSTVPNARRGAAGGEQALLHSTFETKRFY